MNEITDVTTDSFREKVLRSEKPVLVDFRADWCGPCRKLEPVLDGLAQEMDAVKFCRVDVEHDPKLAGLYQIRSVPTLMVFRGGQPVVSRVGLRGRESILDMLGMENGI